MALNQHNCYSGPKCARPWIELSKWMNLFLWDQMKIEYAKQNANQLSGELVSLVFSRVMEQASKERATMDTTCETKQNM